MPIELTDGEKRVGDYVVRGFSSKQIAVKLDCSTKSVERTRKRLQLKTKTINPAHFGYKWALLSQPAKARGTR